MPEQLRSRSPARARKAPLWLVPRRGSGCGWLVGHRGCREPHQGGRVPRSPAHSRFAGLAPAEACIALSDDAAVQRSQPSPHRGKDKPTNVLSFPAPQRLPGQEHATAALGDIVLGTRDGQREAGQQILLPHHHLQHLVVHGFCIPWASITRPRLTPKHDGRARDRDLGAARYFKSLCRPVIATQPMTTDAQKDERSTTAEPQAQRMRMRHPWSRASVRAWGLAKAPTPARHARKGSRGRHEAPPAVFSVEERKMLRRVAAVRRLVASTRSWCRAQTSSLSRKAAAG